MTPGHTSETRPATCPNLVELRAYALGDLPQGQTLALVPHIVRCDRCTAFLLALPETTGGAIESLSAAPVDADGPTPVKTGPMLSTPHRRPDSPAAPARPPALRLGRYSIRRQIGKGGFGTVYLAHDEELDRPVAVKVPYADRIGSPEDLALYHAEARLHASLDHPNVVPIYDVGHSADAPFYLVSKLIEGENLAERLARQRRPGACEAAALLLPLAEALDHMHGRGLVHRDIKPSNILLDGTGKPYLADFGLAMRVVADGLAPGAQAFVGTPAYMSPEQARGDGDCVDGRSDLYSLGVVLYELLTGERPFQGDRTSLLDKILHHEPRPVRAVAPDVPEGLEAICRKAMTKDPAARYRRAGDLAADLRRFSGGARPASRRRGVVLALAAIAVVALLGMVWAARQGKGPAPPPPIPPPAAGGPVVKDGVRVVAATEPAGASLTFVPLDDKKGLPQPDQRTAGKAGEEVTVRPGLYLVIAVIEEGPGKGRFHEVYRTVPRPEVELRESLRHQKWERKAGAVHLAPITLPGADITRGMCLFAEAKQFVVGSDQLRLGKIALAPTHRRRVPAFYLDTTEVTREAYRRRVEGARFKPQPGDNGDYPMADVTWDQAVAHAELVGKRLPDEAEYEYAATAGGTRRFPWGESDAPLQSKEWAFGPAGQPRYDRLEGRDQPDVFGLYSNVAEWTSSWPQSFPNLPRTDLAGRLRVVRGGPHSVLGGATRLAEWPVWGPRWRFGVDAPVSYPGLGFRCARSARPRVTPEDFGAILDR